MAPLVGGEWAEVKTLAIGTVGERITREGERVVHTHDLTYFSRLTDAAQFGHLATIATHAAGTARAGIVCAVVDGADWLQGFIDRQCPQAVRILDFPHAAEHLTVAAHAVFGPGTPAATAWLDQSCTELKEGDPEVVLAAVAALAQHPDASPAAQQTCHGVLAYLQTRREQITYAAFQALGYPIGDGSVESANKLVMEARLKGSGMRWARKNVTPMVALRACVCSDQWERGWNALTAQLRQQEQERRQHRRSVYREERHQRAVVAPEPEIAPPPVPPPAAPLLPPREKLVVAGRPTAAHPWRRFRLPGSPDFPPPAKS
jgi:hypothetical protein